MRLRQWASVTTEQKANTIKDKKRRLKEEEKQLMRLTEWATSEDSASIIKDMKTVIYPGVNSSKTLRMPSQQKVSICCRDLALEYIFLIKTLHFNHSLKEVTVFCLVTVL